ncbi:hypothetical protein BGZ98_009933 [Dissophora globulifera]|nr:hypothetical protein BGZ98_009933 [Dissophora globulifera]
MRIPLASGALSHSIIATQERSSPSNFMTVEAEFGTFSIVAVEDSPIISRASGESPTYFPSVLPHKRLSHDKELHSASHIASPSETRRERLNRDKSESLHQLSEIRQRRQEDDIRFQESEAREEKMIEQELAKNQQHQQISDYIAGAESRHQAIMRLTFELQEYPIPRHFIILPVEPRKLDFARSLVSTPFRLHFLCEGGDHTGCEDDGSTHKMHLANHMGYDIAQQSKFIKKYGPYLLRMLDIVKVSIIAAEFAVPAMQHFKLVQNLDLIADFLKVASKPFIALLDEVISTIRAESAIKDDSIGTPLDSADLEHFIRLKGPELRQLESFLSLNDPSHVLGNLNRIPTKSGHIKWVCDYHYERLYSTSSVKELQTFTKVNGGTFIVKKGMVRIGLDSETRAEEFYRAMAKAENVHELQVALEWTVTEDHLQEFHKAVTQSKIQRLELSGCGKADGTSEIDGALFRPLLDLMSNGHIQTMILERVYHRDFLYVDESGMGTTSKLRILTFKDMGTLDNGRIPTLPKILEFFPRLTTLSVKSEFAHDVLSRIQRDPSRFLRLETLVVHETGQRHYHLVVRLSRSKIKSVEVMRLSSGGWNADGIQELLFCGHITKLGVLLDVAKAHGDRCMEILRCNPNVLEFHLFIPELSASAVDWAISSMRESHTKQKLIPQQQIKINCDTYPDVVSCTLDFNKDSQAVTISTYIQLIPHECKMDNLIALIGKYGWSVTHLDFRGHFNRELALALDGSVSKSDSSLKRLLLDPARLVSSEDFACVDRIIRQSKNLSNFSAVLRMNDINWKAGARWLFGAHGELLTGLTLEGAKGIIWNRELAKLFPSRSILKNLNALSLKRVDTAKDAKSFGKWVADMTSNPTATDPSPQRTLLKMFTRGKLTLTASDSSDRTHLKQVELDSITLDKGRWQKIFESMDYTALETLTLLNNEFTLREIEEVLVNRIVNFVKKDGAELPLRELNIGARVGGLWHPSDRTFTSLKVMAPQLLR